MNENKSAGNFIMNTAKYILSIKIIIGFLLIAIGLFSAITFISLTYQIIVKSDSIALLESIIKIPNQNLEVITISDSYTLSISKTIVYYIISFVFLSIGVSITVKILKIGVGMIEKLELKYLIQKLIAEWDNELKNKTNKPDDDNNLFKKRR